MIQRGQSAQGISRRDMLLRTAGGVGGLGLAAMLNHDLAYGDSNAPGVGGIDPIDPLRPRAPHFAPQAQSVIFLFQYGGPPQCDTFDYKPMLHKLNGQPVPESIKSVKDSVGGVFEHCHDRLLMGPGGFSQRGESGLWVADCFPHLGAHMDDLCVINSMYCDSSNHAPATLQMNTGAILSGRPSLGSWLTYGLGSENQNLPGYVLLFKVGGLGGPANWSNGFLPAVFQGTRFRHQGEPVMNLRPPDRFAGVQRSTLNAIRSLNLEHRRDRAGVDGDPLDARIASYELAYRMQAEALDVGDVESESAETREMYGIDNEDKGAAEYARMCLISRRLVERGVRVVQTYNAVDKLGWDSHEKNSDYVTRNARQTDRPIAALLNDLKQRGLLDTTLVVWAGEFGRTPMEQGDGGRNHNPYGFTIWMAGGGVKGGQAIGQTDEIGLRAAVDPQPVKNLHATILHQMGISHEDLYFERSGRQERLTGVAGTAHVIEAALR